MKISKSIALALAVVISIPTLTAPIVVHADEVVPEEKVVAKGTAPVVRDESSYTGAVKSGKGTEAEPYVLDLAPRSTAETVDIQLKDGEEGSSVSGIEKYSLMKKEKAGTLTEIIAETTTPAWTTGKPSNAKKNQKKPIIDIQAEIPANGVYVLTAEDAATNATKEFYRFSNIFTPATDGEGNPLPNGGFEIFPDNGGKPITPTKPKQPKPDENIGTEVKPGGWEDWEEGDDVNEVVSAKITEIKYKGDKDATWGEKFDYTKMLGDKTALTQEEAKKIEVEVTRKEQIKGAWKSAIKFTAPHSAKYKVEFTDTAGKTGSVVFDINYIDYRRPEINPEGSDKDKILSNWTKAPEQKITYTFDSKSGTEFDLLDAKGKVVAKVDEKATTEIKDADDKVIGKIDMDKHTTLPDGTKQVKVVVTMTGNEDYTIAVKDKVGKLEDTISVKNFDRIGSKITVKKATVVKEVANTNRNLPLESDMASTGDDSARVIKK